MIGQGSLKNMLGGAEAVLGSLLDTKSITSVLQVSKADSKTAYINKAFFVSFFPISTAQAEIQKWVNSPYNIDLPGLSKKLENYFVITKQAEISPEALFLLTTNEEAMLYAFNMMLEEKEYDKEKWPSRIMNDMQAAILSDNSRVVQMILKWLNERADLWNNQFIQELLDFTAKFGSWAMTEVILGEAVYHDSDLFYQMHYKIGQAPALYPIEVKSNISSLYTLYPLPLFKGSMIEEKVGIENWSSTPLKTKIHDDLMEDMQSRCLAPKEAERYKFLAYFTKFLSFLIVAIIIASIVATIIFPPAWVFIVFSAGPLGTIAGICENVRRRHINPRLLFSKKASQRLADYTLERLSGINTQPIDDLDLFARLAEGCALLHTQQRLTEEIVQKLNQYCALHPEQKEDRRVRAYLAASVKYPMPAQPYSYEHPMLTGMIQSAQDSKREDSHVPFLQAQESKWNDLQVPSPPEELKREPTAQYKAHL